MKIILVACSLVALFSMPARAESVFSSTDTFKREMLVLKDSAGEMVTTPVKKPVEALACAAVVGTTMLFDSSIRTSVQHGRTKVMDRGAEIANTVGEPLWHLAAAGTLYTASVVAGSGEWQRRGLVLGEALVLADGATFLMKGTLGRGGEGGAHWKPFSFDKAFTSFPSGHTASSFAFASAIAHTTDSLPVQVGSYLAATFVGYSRLENNAHWASDVLMGALIGELSGRIASASHRDSGVRLVPVIGDKQVGVGVQGHF